MAISATQTTVLIGDNDGDGFIDPLDVVLTTVTITNASGGNATNVQLNETLQGMTQTGDINVSPLAFNDSYTAIGNTLLEVGNVVGPSGIQTSNGTRVTANDLEFFSDNFIISAFDAVTTGGGTVTMITSGADIGS